MAQSTTKRAARPHARRAGPDGALRAPLTRERVVRAAIDLADSAGIDSLSMRKLAEQLEVEAMSLYHHVANKDDLLAGMMDVVMAEIDLPSAPPRGAKAKVESDWKPAIRRGVISYRQMLRRHPWARSLLSSPTGMRPGRLRVMEWLLRRLREGGFSAELTYHAYHALDSHIVGSAAWAAGYAAFATDRKAEQIAEQALRELPLDQMPYLAEHVQQHMTGFGKAVSQFEFGLDLLLDGLERMRLQDVPSQRP